MEKKTKIYNPQLLSLPGQEVFVCLLDKFFVLLTMSFKLRYEVFSSIFSVREKRAFQSRQLTQLSNELGNDCGAGHVRNLVKNDRISVSLRLLGNLIGFLEICDSLLGDLTWVLRSCNLRILLGNRRKHDWRLVSISISVSVSVCSTCLPRTSACLLPHGVGTGDWQATTSSIVVAAVRIGHISWLIILRLLQLLRCWLSVHKLSCALQA